MGKISIGVVGCGDVAQHFYLCELHRLKDRAELLAVCDLNEERAKKTGEQFGARACFTDLAHLLRESDAEVILNLTPHKAHAAVTQAALDAGRHVYSEKPLAQSLRDATQLIETAASKGLKLACAPTTMLLPTAIRWQELLNEGAIGRVTFARAQKVGPPMWSSFQPEHKWFFSEGCGVLMEEGVYPLTALTGFFGPAKRVCAMAGTIIPERVISDGAAAGEIFQTEADDSAHLLLEFDGFFAALDCSWCAHASRNEGMEVHGENGVLAGNPTYADTALEIFHPGRGWQTEEPGKGRTRIEAWILGIEHFLESIFNDSVPINSAEHARHVLDIMLTAGRSAREGQTIELQTDFQHSSGLSKIKRQDD